MDSTDIELFVTFVLGVCVHVIISQRIACMVGIWISALATSKKSSDRIEKVVRIEYSVLVRWKQCTGIDMKYSNRHVII